MKDTERIAELERKMDIMIKYLEVHDKLFDSTNSKIHLVQRLTRINSRLIHEILER